MRQPPAVVRALWGTEFLRPDGATSDWWASLRMLAERAEGSTDELVERARSAIARSELSRGRPMFESLEESIEHALGERCSSPRLSVRVEEGTHGRRITVSLGAGIRGNVRAMAILQGGLLAVLSVLTAEVGTGDLTARGFELDVGRQSRSFRARLAARGLEDDVLALGLDPDRLGRLVEDGPSSASPPKLTLRGLETQFLLTPTQGRIALRLASGSSLREAADSLDITYATARTHLKQVFAKLDVRTQPGLVAKLLGVKP